MSFHEKSAWACLVLIIGVYMPYFVAVFRQPMAAVGLFVAAAVGLAVLLTVFHVVNALATRTIRATGRVPPADELDRHIELSASKWAGLVLAFAVMSWILFAMYALPFAGVPEPGVVPLARAMTAIQWLFAGFVFANVAYYAGIVVGYRRMALG